MDIFLLGDFESNNGPGNANRKVCDSIAVTYNTKYSQKTGKIGRIVEMYIGILRSDVLIICSKSDINYWAIKLAKRHGKKIVYLMHGYASYESKIANPAISARQLSKIKKYETFVFEAADRIVCVSKKFMEYMQNQQGSLFSLTIQEYSLIMDMIRESNPVSQKSAEDYTKKEFLKDVYMKNDEYEDLSGDWSGRVYRRELH